MAYYAYEPRSSWRPCLRLSAFQRDESRQSRSSRKCRTFTLPLTVFEVGLWSYTFIPAVIALAALVRTDNCVIQAH